MAAILGRTNGNGTAGDSKDMKSWNRVKLNVKRRYRSENLNDGMVGLIALERIVENIEPITRYHCQRLGKQGKAFGEFLGLCQTEILDLTWGGYLHDIGKIAIPDRILLKPSTLTSAEWELMKQHAVMGEKISQALGTKLGIVQIIRHHHERWEGGGYPDGLVRHEIPYLAQVIHILDIYDALTHDRPYKEALASAVALEVLEQEAAQGSCNPEIVEQFIEFICFKGGGTKELDSACAIASHFSDSHQETFSAFCRKYI